MQSRTTDNSTSKQPCYGILAARDESRRERVAKSGGLNSEARRLGHFGVRRFNPSGVWGRRWNVVG